MTGRPPIKKHCALSEEKAKFAVSRGLLGQSDEALETEWQRMLAENERRVEELARARAEAYRNERERDNSLEQEAQVIAVHRAGTVPCMPRRFYVAAGAPESQCRRK